MIEQLNLDRDWETAQYYDFSTDEYIDNAVSKNKLRTLTEFKYMVRNLEYPYLLANTDALVNWSAKAKKADAIGECKTISRQSAEKYEGKIPPYYISQVHHYMIVCQPLLRELRSEIYVLQDGREFWGMQVPKVDWMWDAVINEAGDFWNLILKGRDIIENSSNDQQRNAGLAEIEPDPDDSDAIVTGKQHPTSNPP